MNAMRLSICLLLCLTSVLALPQDVGTGKNGAKAADAPGGPKCKGSQVGLCCDATRNSSNCQTAFTASIGNGSSASPACSNLTAGYYNYDLNTFPTLVPFCCDEMNVPGAGCLAANEPVGPTGDFDTFCCASGNDKEGGIDCVTTYDSAPCPADVYPGRPIFCS